MPILKILLIWRLHDMERCGFCGTPQPEKAQFCGACGRSLPDGTDIPTSLLGSLAEGLPVDNGPTAMGGTTPPTPWQRRQASNFAQPLYNWGKDELVDADEEDEKEGVFPLPGEGQPASGTPTVQGTPQWSGVPAVQSGTDAPSAAAPLRNAASAPRPFASSAAPNTPPVLWPLTQGTTPPSRPSTIKPRSPSFANKTTIKDGSPSHAPAKKPSPRSSSCALVALIIAVVCLIFVGTIGGLLFGMPPTIIIVGSTTVTAGDNLHVHGTHFLPGGSITLTLDESIPLFAAAPHPLARPHSALPLEMTIAGQLASVSSTGLKADGLGNFDVTLPVSANWSIGTHTIKATEAVTGRSYSQKFTVTLAAQLLVKPTLLDFGQLEVGSKAVLSVVLNNGGRQQLNWQATTGGETWLKLSLTSGSLPFAASPQFMYVTADVTHLKVGKYATTLTITSNGGNAQLDVKLEVIPPTATPQAKLYLAPTSLDFGTLDVGSQQTQAITISNSGNLALNWKADTGNASWVTLDSTAHTIAPGGQPDTVNVTVDTTNLAAGSQSATVTITSNGGKAEVAITVVVNVPPPPPTATPSPTPTATPTSIPTATPSPTPTSTPSPTPTATPSPTPTPIPSPTISVSSPCTLQAPSQSNLAFTADTGTNPGSQSFTIAVTGTCDSGVTITPTAAVATGTGWLAVTPPSTTPRGGSATFTVNVTSANLAVGSYSGTITLAASNGTSTLAGSPQTVNVTLTVNQAPVGSVSPTSLTFNVLTTDSASSQDVTIANTGGGALDWSASLQKAPSFVQQSASSGTNVTGSTSATDSITVNPSGVTAGSYSATLTISMTNSLTGSALSESPVTVTITINVTSPPSMQLSPTSLTFTPSSCVYTASGTVTLTNTGGGTLSWTVSSPTYTTTGDPGGWLTVSPGQGSGDATLTFSADGSGSGLTPGQTYTATVTITPSSGSAQTVTVSFTIPYCLG